jgi:hypothetical protein
MSSKHATTTSNLRGPQERRDRPSLSVELEAAMDEATHTLIGLTRGKAKIIAMLTCQLLADQLHHAIIDSSASRHVMAGPPTSAQQVPGGGPVRCHIKANVFHPPRPGFQQSDRWSHRLHLSPHTPSRSTRVGHPLGLSSPAQRPRAPDGRLAVG